VSVAPAKQIPPPLGIGSVCMLLSLGVSTKPSLCAYLMKKNSKINVNTMVININNDILIYL
jgi:hypothetical protein